MERIMFDLTGKTALVTGATQGIGFDIALELAKHGAKVFVNGATSMEKCEKASEQIPGSVPVLANLLKVEDMDKLYETTGDVDILVLNASIQYKRGWDGYSLDEYETQFDCNVKSTYYLMTKYTPGMKKKGFGRIVTIGSVNQYNQHPELSLYGATKAAQKKLVENVAPSLAPYGVTVNNIAPGAIDTPRNADFLSSGNNRELVNSKIPCGYVGEPKDISPAVLLMCSDEGRYITGADLIIDGGTHLR